MMGETWVQGSGAVESETRSVANFKRVLLSGIGQVEIEQGETERLEVEAEDNILPLIVTEVREDRLIIGMQRHTHVSPTRPIRFSLTVKSLEAIEMSGAGSITGSQLTAQPLSLNLSGSGRLALHNCPVHTVNLSGAGSVHIDGLDVPELNATLSGTGQIEIAGRATEQTVRLPGAGSYEAGALESRHVKVDVSGAGRALVDATETIQARISGAGMIEYTGAARLTKQVSGFGMIRRRSQGVWA